MRSPGIQIFIYCLIDLTGLPTVSTGFGGTTALRHFANITCKVIGAYSRVFWEHQYNGVTSVVNTSDSSKYSGGTILTPSLTIYSFAVSDIGSYRCSAQNSVGTAHSPTMAFMDIPKCNFFSITIMKYVWPGSYFFRKMRNVFIWNIFLWV